MTLLPFFEKIEATPAVNDVKNYDIVVVGAGSPGIPCAFKAAELGAKVAIIQKGPIAMAQGNYG
ncbi:MAG: FAD-binding protein, partial [Veillonella sp.]|nr:FAD-binding protein [Veillonella sp.]